MILWALQPDCGVVAGGDQQVIKLEFCSDRLGPIDEEFEWGIQGRPDSLFLRLKGRDEGGTPAMITA